jgi:hypothetical protein
MLQNSEVSGMIRMGATKQCRAWSRLTSAAFHGDKANLYELKATAFIIFSSLHLAGDGQN